MRVIDELEKEEAHAEMPALLAAGVKCYEYQPGMAHEKVCAIDGKFATVGSSNLDARSLRNNHELNVMAVDPTFAGQLEAAIRSDIDTKSKQITKVDDPLLQRLIAPMLRLQGVQDEV